MLLVSELAAAKDRDDVASLSKSPNLRDDGEPIGAWRWLDASAEEDDPIVIADDKGEPVGSRITAESLWEMAAGLNTRASAVPINGGGAPRPGLGDSLPHGDDMGGDHLANGYAHVGLPVIDHTGRTHLYLWSELLPEIAPEVDLGRLAYGSIRFGFDSADPDDGYAIKGAVLISHALTNDPAVTSLTAGSERRRIDEPTHVACRSRRTHMARQNTSRRGPVRNALLQIATMLGLTEETLTEDPYSIIDAVYALKDAAKAEQVTEAVLAADLPDPVEGETVEEASARGAFRALCAVSRSRRNASKRELEGVEPGEEVDVLGLAETVLRTIFGKPDASVPDLLAELEARADEIAAFLADDGDDGEAGEAGEAAAQRSARGRELTSLRSRVSELESNVRLHETREWLDTEIAARGLTVPEASRARWITMAIDKGRDVVTEILDARNAPPSGNPMGGREPGPSPVTLREAANACMAEVREAHPKDPSHVQRARAQKLARSRWPHLQESGAAE